MKSSVFLLLGLALFFALASASSFEKLERQAQGVVKVAENFVTKFLTKSYHATIKSKNAAHASTPHHQRRRHFFMGKTHVDTKTEPAFDKNEDYKTLRRHSEPEDLHEYYVNFKKADIKNIEKIESDFEWDKIVRHNGVQKSRLSSYIPHNTFVFVGTEAEALQLQDHDLVYWVGARDPLHKLAGSLGSHPNEREVRNAIDKSFGDVNEFKDVVRFHFHSGITTEEQVKKIMQDFEDILEHLNLEATVTFEQVEPDEFVVFVACKEETDAHFVALRLAPYPAVHYVDHPPILRTHNDLANMFVENGEIVDGALGGPDDDYVADRSVSPLSFLNGAEDGTFYLIGLADTGIDWDNCLFFDDNVPMLFDTENTRHRKIRYYDTTYGDRSDGVYHGTHMAGTLAGKEERPSGTSYPVPEGIFDGLVPEAKIIFADMATGSSENIIPPTRVADVYDLTFLRGAHVNVYGWGTRTSSSADGAFYSDLDFRTDEYAYLHRNWISLFPTGNRLYSRSPLPINSPAASKNPLSISTSRSFHEATTRYYGRTGEENRDLYNFFYQQLCTGQTFFYNDPAFCASLGFSAPCSQLATTDVCPQFTDVSGCCNFAYFQPLCCDSFFQENFNTSLTSSKVLFNEFVLDGNGNYGPLFDGRFGVDFVFPGTGIVSANSDQDTTTLNCGNDAGFKVLNGTSMSTAVAGGAVLKVIQYFEQGYYPFGDKTRSNNRAFTPTSSLVKALLMASAVSMKVINGNQRNFNFDSSHLGVPNIYEGMGAPVLSRVLHVLDPDDSTVFTDPPYGLRRIAIGSTDDDPNHVYLSPFTSDYHGCFRTTLQATHFSVTIVWNDPPATRNSGFALVNDLDLVVTSTTGDEVFTSHAEESFDIRNNYEYVRFESVSSSLAIYPNCSENHPTVNCIYQQYSVRVHAQTLVTPTAELPFSLVVHAWQVDSITGEEEAVGVLELGQTGDEFNDVPLSCSVMCPRACSGYGFCLNSGRCQCDSGYSGVDCSLSVCEGDCSGNGVCNGETGECDCIQDFVGTVCEVFNPTGEAVTIIVPTNCSCDCGDGVSTATAVGIGVGCFGFGFLLGFLLGGYFGIQWLVAKKKKKVAEIKQRMAAREGGMAAGESPEGP